MTRRVRLDAELVRRQLARSRDHAADLIARGVPASAIACDYAGFRTLDRRAATKLSYTHRF